jgi:hypothetical protein
VQLRLRMALAVSGDFESGRVLNVAGWRLAATEARLYALASLYLAQLAW